MKEMEAKILTDGKVLPGHILKVGSFLNQQVDVEFMTKCAEYVANEFRGVKIDKVMTIEASGIPYATLLAQAIGAKMVIVKKHSSANQAKEVYSAEVASYTHGNTYNAVVAKEYICKGDRLLLADDFLASGNAFNGMISIAEQAEAEIVGCTAAIEKGFQHGGDILRNKGIKVVSLAIVESMTDSAIEFRV